MLKGDGKGGNSALQGRFMPPISVQASRDTRRHKCPRGEGRHCQIRGRESEVTWRGKCLDDEIEISDFSVLAFSDR